MYITRYAMLCSYFFETWLSDPDGEVDYDRSHPTSKKHVQNVCETSTILRSSILLDAASAVSSHREAPRFTSWI